MKNKIRVSFDADYPGIVIFDVVRGGPCWDANSVLLENIPVTAANPVEFYAYSRSKDNNSEIFIMEYGNNNSRIDYDPLNGESIKYKNVSGIISNSNNFVEFAKLVLKEGGKPE